MEKYNIRDTKRYYSDINNKVLSGCEITTIKSNTYESVCHLKNNIWIFY